MTIALAARTNGIENRWFRIAVIALIMAILVPLLILGPGATPAEAGISFKCLVSLAGVGAAVVGVTVATGTTGAAVAAWVGGFSAVVSVTGDCLRSSPYWWGNFPYYYYRGGGGGGLVKVL